MAQSPQLQFYLARAAQANADAESATLDNVRDRCRRSEEAWNILAERAARTEKMRSGSASSTSHETQLPSENDESEHEEDPEQ
jgi:hypothetical protein